MAQAGRAGLWSKWVLANSIGELIGLGATFAIGAGMFSGLAETSGTAAALISAGLMTATGALEGPSSVWRSGLCCAAPYRVSPAGRG